MIEVNNKPVCFRCLEIKPDVQSRLDPTDKTLKMICEGCMTILIEDAVGDEDNETYF